MLFRSHFGTIFGSFLDHFRTTFGSFSDHFRIIFGPFSDHFWTIFGSFSDHFRIIFGPFSDHFRTIFGSFLDHLRIIFALFVVIFCNYLFFFLLSRILFSHHFLAGVVETRVFFLPAPAAQGLFISHFHLCQILFDIFLLITIL